jgi:hypothetical protein
MIAALDARFEERHVLDPSRPHNRESLVWVLALPEEELGAFAYTWVDGHGQAGAAGVVFGPRLAQPVFELVDGIGVDHAMGFADWRVGPIRAAHADASQTADVAFAGQDLRLELSFAALHAPYSYASHADGFPSFFADDRHEQGGRARGTLSVGGEDIAFDGYCQRDHSWGARDWGAVTHYKWLNFLAPGCCINVMDLQAFGRTAIRGYVHADGQTAEIVAARFDYDFDDDFTHHDLHAEFDDSAGRTTTARMLAAPAAIQYPINPRLTLVDVAGAAEVAGEAGVTYAEMAWPPDYLADRRAGARS